MFFVFGGVLSIRGLIILGSPSLEHDRIEAIEEWLCEASAYTLNPIP